MAPVKPKRRQCGSMEAHEQLSELYSSFRTNQNRIESFLVVTRASSSEPERILRIVSAEPDRLVVAKG